MVVDSREQGRFEDRDGVWTVNIVYPEVLAEARRLLRASLAARDCSMLCQECDADEGGGSPDEDSGSLGRGDERGATRGESERAMMTMVMHAVMCLVAALTCARTTKVLRSQPGAAVVHAEPIHSQPMPPMRVRM